LKISPPYKCFFFYFYAPHWPKCPDRIPEDQQQFPRFDRWQQQAKISQSTSQHNLGKISSGQSLAAQRPVQSLHPACSASTGSRKFWFPQNDCGLLAKQDFDLTDMPVGCFTVSNRQRSNSHRFGNYPATPRDAGQQQTSY